MPQAEKKIAEDWMQTEQSTAIEQEAAVAGDNFHGKEVARIFSSDGRISKMFIGKAENIDLHKVEFEESGKIKNSFFVSKEEIEIVLALLERLEIFEKNTGRKELDNSEQKAVSYSNVVSMADWSAKKAKRSRLSQKGVFDIAHLFLKDGKEAILLEEEALPGLYTVEFKGNSGELANYFTVDRRELDMIRSLYQRSKNERHY